ncbi:hypothetical protein D0Y65_035243 [Glycine soja]|uniref:Cytochrome c oxidase assembly factor 5 n=2 Tax=Glycine subgen. Soja TaxID=1462606 RepID=K7LWH3_SOYBN|nr:hypothetical protein D0Y65_035243 [Glycine soja]
MSKSCKGLAMELVKCLSESDCVKVEKRSYKECVGEKSPCIPSECVGLRETYFNCKRGQASVYFFNLIMVPSM